MVFGFGENFYLSDEMMQRSPYDHVPRMDLRVNGATAENYMEGPLEDWIPGALTFDGTRVAVPAHSEIVKDVTYVMQPKEKETQ